MNELTIKIFDQFAELSYKGPNNALVNKIVDIADLHAVFKDNVNHDTGDLAVFGDGVIGVRRIISRGDKMFVLVNAINPCVDMTFDGSPIKHVYFPSLIMAVHLTKPGRKYRVDKSKTVILAHEHNLIDGNSQLYRFPFCNVHQGVGRICWGRIEIPMLDTPGQSIGVLQIFMQGDMNNVPF